MVVREIVEVTWLDAQGGIQSMTKDEMARYFKPLRSKSVGYLVYETKEYIILSFMEFGNGLFKHQQVIPRGIIKDIKVIREGKK